MMFKIIVFLAAIAIVSCAEIRVLQKRQYAPSFDAAERKIPVPLVRPKRFWFTTDEEETEKPSNVEKRLDDIEKMIKELNEKLKEQNSGPQSAQPYVYYPIPARPPPAGHPSGPPSHSGPATSTSSKAFAGPEGPPTPASTVHTIKVEVVPCTKCSVQGEPSKKNPEREAETPVAPAKPPKPNKVAEKPASDEEKPPKVDKEEEKPASDDEKPPKVDKDEEKPASDDEKPPKPADSIPEFPDETDTTD